MYLLRHNPAFYHGLFDPTSTVLMARPNCLAPPSNNNNHHEESPDNKVNKTVYRSIDANASESDDQFTLTMDLPGVKSDTLTVQVSGGGSALSIAADRPTANGTVVAYRQRFAVDEDMVDADKLRATLADGVLTVVLPKKETAKPIEVPVTEGEAADRGSGAAEDLRITFDVPGIKASDLKVVVRNGVLYITGERQRGQSVARLKRTMMLDRHRTDLTQPRAYLAHGVLTFTAPHKEQVAAKTIELSGVAAQQQNVLVETVPEEEANVKM